MSKDRNLRPWLMALLIAIATQTLFGLGVTRVDHLVFDETHYVPAARHIMSMDEPANIEHPLVAKTIIAGSMLLLGDDALGWRGAATVAGTMAVLGVFALTFVIFGSTGTATAAALIAALNGMVYVQSRIAMIDAFLAAFIVWGLAFAAMAARSHRPWPHAVGSGLCFGLATGCKWMAGPFIAAVCIGLLWMRRRDVWNAAREGATNAGQRHMGGCIRTGTGALHRHGLGHYLLRQLLARLPLSRQAIDRTS